MSYVPLPDDAGKVKTFEVRDGTDVLEVQAVALVDPVDGEPLTLASEITQAGLLAALESLNATATAIQLIAEVLNAKAIELNTGAMAGTVELGAASLAALESVSVANLPETQPVQAESLPLPAGAATEATLAALKAAADAIKVAAESLNAKAGDLNTSAVSGMVELGAASLAALENVSVANLPGTQPVSAESLPLPAGAATDAKQDAITTALATLLTELQLKPDVGDLQRVAVEDLSYLERVALKALSRLTYTLQGARVDCGGSLVGIASGQTLATVTTLGSATNVALGRTTTDGMSALLMQLNYNNGFRSRLS